MITNDGQGIIWLNLRGRPTWFILTKHENYRMLTPREHRASDIADWEAERSQLLT